jgi:SnoaL-like domain
LIDFAQQYAGALAIGDVERIARWYHRDARSYGPLAWPEAGAEAITASPARSAARLDGLQTELHNVFANAAGDRAALRLVRRWSQGTARRSAIQTRYLRLADDLIVEEFAGPNTFQIALLRAASSRHAEAPLVFGSDRQGQLLERDGQAPTFWLVNCQLVMSALLVHGHSQCNSPRCWMRAEPYQCATGRARSDSPG